MGGAISRAACTLHCAVQNHQLHLHRHHEKPHGMGVTLRSDVDVEFKNSSLPRKTTNQLNSQTLTLVAAIYRMNRVAHMLTSDSFSVYRTVLAGVGAAYLLRIALKTLCSLAGGFRGYFLAPWGISRINLTKYGSWAIVTGASEGIGRGYALELAKHGLNIVIMSRSEDKLQAAAEEIRSKYNREVRYLVVDFTQGQSVYDDIQAEISDLDIAVLVNNVGLAPIVPSLTGDVDEERHRNIIELNCQSMVQMTHLVLPKMVEKKKGIIVNLSSISALTPTAFLNVYAATKKFVQYFSDALRYEYRSQGITVQTVYPALVSTAMTGNRHPKYWAPSPERYARTAVATIGVQNDTYGYFCHAVQLNLILLLPQWIRLFIKNRLLSGGWIYKKAKGAISKKKKSN